MGARGIRFGGQDGRTIDDALARRVDADAPASTRRRSGERDPVTMWPWEHLAFGYVLYSGYCRLAHRRPPRSLPVVALVVATQLPDLIDKPLAWTFDVLPTGQTLGHSVFFAAAVIVAAAVAARRLGHPAVGPAVAIGYGSHLLGDVVYTLVRRGDLAVDFLLWPVVEQSVRETPGLYLRIAGLFAEFVDFLGSPAGQAYLAFELALALVLVVLWTADGWPGLPTHA